MLVLSAQYSVTVGTSVYLSYPRSSRNNSNHVLVEFNVSSSFPFPRSCVSFHWQLFWACPSQICTALNKMRATSACRQRDERCNGVHPSLFWAQAVRSAPCPKLASDVYLYNSRFVMVSGQILTYFLNFSDRAPHMPHKSYLWLTPEGVCLMRSVKRNIFGQLRYVT